jgi:hypothetical protein
MSSFWNLASTYGPWLLAFLGAAVTLIPPEKIGNWRCPLLAAFAAFAFLTAQGTAISQRTIERKLTGGDCFAIFLSFPFTPERIIGPPYKMVIRQGPPYKLTIWIYPPEVSENCALFDATYTITMLGSTPFDSRTIFTKTEPYIPPWNSGTGIELPSGKFIINMVARNGPTFERLDIPQSGPAHQTVEVHRVNSATGRDEIIYQLPQPKQNDYYPYGPVPFMYD